jgi:hypothetical protein
MNSITAANRSNPPPVSNERRLLIAKRGDGTDILYDEAGVRRELNGALRRIGIGSYTGFNGRTEPGCSCMISMVTSAVLSFLKQATG